MLVVKAENLEKESLMSTLLWILAAAGICVSLATSLSTESSRKVRRLVVVGASVAFLAVCGQWVSQRQSNEQNRVLHAKVDTLAEAGREMRDMLAPVLEIAKDRSPGTDDKKALGKLLQEISKMHPKLVFLENRTKAEKDSVTGLLKTTYVYRSQYPVVVRDATVKLRFNCRIFKANSRLPNTLPFKGNSTLNIHRDGKGVTFFARHLGEGSDIELSVFSRIPPKIESSELFPQ